MVTEPFTLDEIGRKPAFFADPFGTVRTARWHATGAGRTIKDV
jgi:hypothetical protein